MTRKLHRWMRRTGDPRTDPNDMSFDEYPYVRKAMKALVLDMDGTLVDADGKVFLWVSEKVKELYSRGIKIFLVSSESEVKVNETARKNLGGVEFAKVYSGVSRSDVEAYSSILSEIVKSLGVTGR